MKATIGKLLLGVRRALGARDDLDGCDASDNPAPTPDEEIPFHLLFGDVAGSPRKVAQRKAGLEALLGIEPQP